MPTRLTDRAPLNGTRKTGDGYLVAEAFVARTGIQLYGGHELGDERAVVRVYRGEDEVKAPASVRTYSHAPITMGHPDVLVDSTNHSTLAKGEVSTEAEWVDGKLRLPLIVKDAATIAAIEGGTRELSAGYLCALDHTPGVTPEGEADDAIQRTIRINHVAVVPKGRAGAECRIGDAAEWGASPLTDAQGGVTHPSKRDDIMSDKLTTVVLGDAAVQVAPEDAAKIDGFKRDSAKALTDAEAAHATAIAAKDTEIGELRAKLADAEKAKVSDADLDRMVTERAALVSTVKAIAKDAKTEGLSPAELRKAAVEARYGADAVKDASEAEIAGMFRIAAKDAETKADPVRDHFSRTAPVVPTNDAEREEAAHRAFVDGLNPRNKEAA